MDPEIIGGMQPHFLLTDLVGEDWVAVLPLPPPFVRKIFTKNVILASKGLHDLFTDRILEIIVIGGSKFPPLTFKNSFRSYVFYSPTICILFYNMMLFYKYASIRLLMTKSAKFSLGLYTVLSLKIFLNEFFVSL